MWRKQRKTVSCEEAVSVLISAPLLGGQPMMRETALRTLRATVVAVFTCSGFAACAEPEKLTTIAPIFSQLLVMSQPVNFVAAFEKTAGDRYIREAVPKGESVEQWTKMLTVTGAKGLAADAELTPEGFAGLLANGFKKNCPDTFDSMPLGRLHIGDSEGFAAVAGCGSYKSDAGVHGETALIVTIRGEHDYYTIQWAERAQAAAEKPAIDKAAWMKRLSEIGPVRLCPIVAGEKAPYPSCVEQ